MNIKIPIIHRNIINYRINPTHMNPYKKEKLEALYSHWQRSEWKSDYITKFQLGKNLPFNFCVIIHKWTLDPPTSNFLLLEMFILIKPLTLSRP